MASRCAGSGLACKPVMVLRFAGGMIPTHRNSPRLPANRGLRIPGQVALTGHPAGPRSTAGFAAVDGSVTAEASRRYARTELAASLATQKRGGMRAPTAAPISASWRSSTLAPVVASTRLALPPPPRPPPPPVPSVAQPLISAGAVLTTYTPSGRGSSLVRERRASSHSASPMGRYASSLFSTHWPRARRPYGSEMLVLAPHVCSSKRQRSFRMPLSAGAALAGIGPHAGARAAATYRLA